MIKTLLEQFIKNAKQAPGWVPLVCVCYLLWSVAAEDGAGIGNDMDQHKVVIVPFFAWILYAAGDALDQAIFPRETEKGVRGWKWLASAALEERKDNVKKALSLDSGYYDVSKALAESAGKYTGSGIQFKNELAKFLRSTIFPLAVLGLLLIVRNQAFWGICAVIASPLLLFVYGRLKASHMGDLYKLAVDLSTQKLKDGFAVSDIDGVQLFFWQGKLASSGTRSSHLGESRL